MVIDILPVQKMLKTEYCTGT